MHFKIDKTFFLNPLNRNVILHIGKLENTGDESKKERTNYDL